jgi:nitrogen regulatory protein PII 2
MKEIIAIIRPKQVAKTKDALVALGFPSLTAEPVLGRGKQHGILGELNVEIRLDRLEQGASGGMKYIPKRQLSVIVDDADVSDIVNAIIAVNQTSQIGDGRIFVLPVEEALRVRTGETGSAAVQ